MLARSLTFLIAFALAAPAAAQDNRVLLARLQGAGVDETLVAQVDVGLRSEMGKVVGARLVSGVPPSRPRGCQADACAQVLAAQAGAQLVVLASLAAQDDGSHRLAAGLHDASGRLVVEAERRVDRTPDYRELRGLAVQLLVPGDYTGRVKLTGRPTGAHIVVDNIPVAAAAADEPIPLSVGKHTISVDAPDAARRSLEVDISFDTDVTLSLALDQESPDVGAVDKPPPPLWPALVATGVAAGGAVALAIAVGDYAFTTGWLGLWYSTPGTLDRGPSGANPRSWAVHIGEQVRLYGGVRRAQRNDLVMMIGAGAVTLTSGIAAGVLLGHHAMSSGSAEE
jgi:hypothetical protein